MDAWLESIFKIRIQEVTNFLERGETRKAIDRAFFGVWNDLNWYRRRTNRFGLGKYYVKTWLKLLTPFIPHPCEEMWHMLGERSFISISDWPKVEGGIDTKVIELEETLKKTIEDIKHISELTGRRERLYIYAVTEEEFNHFTSAKDFLKEDLGFSEVNIYRVNDEKRYDPKNRAKRAKPQRPGIYLE